MLQTAAAAALSLLADRDIVVQDSVRYLGGIDLLVELLASQDTYLAEVRGRERQGRLQCGGA